jgi:protein-glutamine gamma-glutamyltransferase
MNKSLIFGILLCTLMVIAPHADHLPLWISGLCAGLLLWRSWIAYSGGHDTLLAKRADRGNGRPAAPDKTTSHSTRPSQGGDQFAGYPAPEGSAPPSRSGDPLPKRWQLMLVTFAGTVGIIFNFHTLFGREAGVALLVMLATLKLMELRNARDAMVLLYLACFIIVTNFFYSQSIPAALYLLATLMVIVTTWVHLQAQSIALKPRMRIAATLLLQALPLTLILFILFPRVQGPLWGLPQDAYASTGLDDRMSPGSLSRLSLSEAVAFRVAYNDKIPRRDQMYWRGPVLWNFDGRTWTLGRTLFTAAPKFTDLDQPVDYAVTLEPHNKHWLFALDVPDKLSVPATLTEDFQWLRKEPVNARLRYTARSYLAYRANEQETARQLQRALQLPGKFDPRARQLAAEWRAGSKDDADIVRTALGYFNKQGFVYTLEPPPVGQDSVDDFLFSTKQGFCEYYASAFVFLMRAADIPARVVTGYLGGEFNEVGNYYIVRQSDAHAWAEVWLAGRGWVRVDPTAAIAPNRVERGLSAALSDNAILPFMERNPPQWMRNLRFNLDALANQWNQWVLGYDTERQFAFLTRLGMESITWQKMALDMMSGLGGVIGLIALFMLRHLFIRQPDRVQAAWLKLCRKLGDAGLPRAAHEGAQDYAARVAASRSDLADAIRDLAARYSALRYGMLHDENAQREFLRRAGALKI